jgi:hypothetical protein
LHDVGKPGTRCLGDWDRRSSVHFIGHERYGLDLLRPILNRLFDPTNAAAICVLIAEHHRANQLVSKFTAPEGGEELRRELLDRVARLPQRRLSQGEFARLSQDVGGDPCQLVLLLIHGLADRMARRGFDNRTCIRQEAEIFLALLASAAFFDIGRPSKKGLRCFRKALQEALQQRGWSKDRESKCREALLKETEQLVSGCPDNDEHALREAIEKRIEKLCL